MGLFGGGSKSLDEIEDEIDQAESELQEVRGSRQFEDFKKKKQQEAKRKKRKAKKEKLKRKTGIDKAEGFFELAGNALDQVAPPIEDEEQFEEDLEALGLR